MSAATRHRPITPEEPTGAYITPTSGADSADLAGALGPELPEAAPGVSLGRYVILEEIAQGGMGRVLRAYDPKLQREVALKEVRRKLLGGEGTMRLIGEARAMAKLSHPNVVAVHDVEECGLDELVLVMEYVAGQTLSSWLRTQRHSWDVIVRHFIASGRGLAHAHAAGLLHRDFKPANVLLGSDGVVKVTDFGLAKLGVASDSQTGASESMSQSGLIGTDDLTQAGVIMGTPRYMAPEQHRSEILTEAADQYCFCVALWEALNGTPPFKCMDRLRELKEAGPPPWTNAKVPQAIVAAVCRGLAPAPSERWPSMDALLAALAYDPRTRRRQQVAWLGSLTLVGGGFAGWYTWEQNQVEPCSGANRQLEETWSDAKRSKVRAAMTSFDKDYADVAWHRTSETLDRYARHWTEMFTDNCRATQIRGEQSPEVMDLRMACLHRAKLTLQATVRVLAAADERVVMQAHDIVGGLRPLERCADVAALQAAVEPPLPEERARVAEIHELLADATAENEAGHFAVAEAKVAEIKNLVASVDYGPIRTEAAHVEGLVEEQLGQYEAAERALRTGLESASRWHQWQEQQEIAAQLLFIVGTRLGDVAGGLRYRDLAAASEGKDPYREASFRNRLGNVLLVAKRFDESATEHRRAISLAREAFGPDDPRVAAFRNDLGLNLLESGANYREAEDEFRRALGVLQKALGDDHPNVAMSRHNLGLTLHAQQRYREADRELSGALEHLIRAFGPEHPAVAEARTSLAESLLKLERVSQARRLAESAWKRRQDADDVPAHEQAETAFLLARALWTADGDDAERSREYARAAKELYRRAHRVDERRAVEAWLDAHREPTQG